MIGARDVASLPLCAITAADEEAGRVAALQAAAARAGGVVNGVVPTGTLAGSCVFLVGREALAFAYGEGRALLGSEAGWRPLIGRRFGAGVINCDEPEHAAQRRAWAPAFGTRALAGHLPKLDDLFARTVARWREAPTIDAYAAARDLAFVAVATTVAELPEDLACALAADYAAIFARADAQESPAMQHARVLPLRDAAEQRLAAAAPRLGSAEGRGLVSSLRREHPDIAPEAIVRMVGLLLLLGHETTASLLAWLLLLLARRPAWQARLADELAAVGPAPTLEALERCRAADAFVAETGRLHSPLVNAPRVALSDFDLAGVRVPAGARIALALGATDRLAAPGVQPQRFAPERHLEHGARGDAGASGYTFGAGARFCLGMRLARLEAKLLLRHVLESAVVLPASAEPAVHAGFWNARPTGNLVLALGAPPRSRGLKAFTAPPA